MLVSRPLATQDKKAAAACAVSDSVGDLVYVRGDLIGSDYNIEKADPLHYEKMPAVGVIVAKLSPTLAIVQFEGEVRGVYSTLVAGRIYFVGADAAPTTSPPAPTLGGRAYVQSIGVAVDAGVLRLEPIKFMNVRTG